MNALNFAINCFEHILELKLQDMVMASLLAGVLLSFGVACSFALHDIPDRYDFALSLEFKQPGAAPFKFFYSYDRDNQMLKMAVKVMSLGWVGIGFSRNSIMPDSDIAIGWVNNSGNGFLQVSQLACMLHCKTNAQHSIV